MCGSWNDGGLRNRKLAGQAMGDLIDLSGDYDEKRGKSTAAAESWKIPLTESELWEPSDICDHSPVCGGGNAFPCGSTRRHLTHVQPPPCDRTCDDVSIPVFREQCEFDNDRTGLNWACEPNYLDPVMVPRYSRLFNTGTGSGEWYVNWADEHCANDGLAGNWQTLFGSALECCRQTLPYKSLEWCEAKSREIFYQGTGKYYVDHQSSCAKDCAPGNNGCTAIIEDSWITLYDTISECCRQKLGWLDANVCASSSNPSGGNTGKFYVDYAGLKCAQDCDSVNGLPCMGPPSSASGFPAALYNTAESCCKEKLQWLDLGQCVADTNGASSQALGSEQWYVDWNRNLGTCVKDCLGNAPCGGLKQNWETAYISASDCCTTAIPWQPSSVCHL